MSANLRALPLRIATFNMENFGGVDGNETGTAARTTLQERIRLLRPQLMRLRADVLCLQEVDGQRRGSSRRRALDALDLLLEGTPYSDFVRASTVSRTRGTPRDKHNLVILSRFPIADERQILHELVAPPRHTRAAGETVAIEWDRPLLCATVHLTPAVKVHVINVHLRAPRAAFVPGGKTSARTWRSMADWAEGFFVAAVKRAGQALEARRLIDGIMDDDAGALIVVCGDFNAELNEIPIRTIRGDEEDAGNPHLAYRTLVAVDRSVADSRRFSVVHHGRPQMLDHVLVSRPLLAWFRGAEVHNEALGDELVTPQVVAGSPESFHAPVVAEFLVETGA
ncbi:MAG: endonuclease/exonuclease/phosphatase family protein [Rhodospirillales bacterium]|nr:endonuclease/exonuclease/phosphatase family protein [Rhodospirillales bacterium]